MTAWARDIFYTFRGFLETAIVRLMDVILAFPSLLLALGLVAILGPALINDATWAKLFEMGSNVHNGITVTLSQRSIQVNKLQTDQLGTGRPANTPGDIGAIENDD